MSSKYTPLTEVDDETEASSVMTDLPLVDDDEDAVDESLTTRYIPAERSLRLTTYLIVEGGLPPWDTIFQVFILTMIFGNVTIFILSTIEWIRQASTNILLAFECFTIIVFMIEYGIRLWCIVEKSKYGKMGPVLGRVAHIFTFGSIIDLVSIVPFWVDMILTIRAKTNAGFYDVRVFSALRILRIFRLFKADKYTASLQVVVEVFKSKSRVLGITGVMGLILFLFTSTALYFTQGSVDPELSSIPASFFSAVLLLTGQGYWNNAPLTPAGKWVVAISNIFSVAVFAIPAGILASGLEPIGQEVHDKLQESRQKRSKAIQAARVKARRRKFVERTIQEATLLAHERSNINTEISDDEAFSGVDSSPYDISNDYKLRYSRNMNENDGLPSTPTKSRYAESSTSPPFGSTKRR